MPITNLLFSEFIFKRASKNLAVGAALVAATMFGSPEASAQKIQKKPTTTTSTSNKALENKIKNYLVNTESIPKWVNDNNDTFTIYTFEIGNNNVSIYRDKYGEGDFYSGKWKLNGNKLTITNTDKNTSETFTVKIIDKETVMIGDDKFYYKPDFT